MRLNHGIAWKNTSAARSEMVAFCTEIRTSYSCHRIKLGIEVWAIIQACHLTSQKHINMHQERSAYEITAQTSCYQSCWAIKGI